MSEEISGRLRFRRAAAAIACLAVGLGGAAVWSGCGDDSDTTGNSIEERVEEGVTDAQENVEEGIDEAEEELEGSDAKKSFENAKKEAEEGLEKGKEEAEKGAEEVEDLKNQYAP